MKLKNIFTLLLVAAMLVCLSACEIPGAATAAEGTAEGGTGSYVIFIYFALIIVVFYFLLIRPENKKKKKAQEMRSSLEVGDEITTIGGMVGTVVSVDGDFITFETGVDRVRIEIAKWAIGTKGKSNVQ